jgi:predicted phosphodiesterase
VLAVVAATLAGGYLALVSFRQDRALSLGTIRLSVSPGHRGALDVYVPLVDWGARFEAIRLPVRLRVDVRTVDRRTVATIAAGQRVDVRAVRAEARDGIAGYLKALIAVTLVAALALGLLTALAVRSTRGPPLKVTAGAAVLTATATAIALVVLLPPRDPIADPQYYAYGPDIPRALEAVEAAQRSSRTLDQELDAQLVGLARLVARPGGRRPLDGRPTITVASDLHNNVLALRVLERAARGGPVFFAGDLTDRGTPLETRLIERVVGAGHPFVFVSGNHDSDTLERRLARRGAIVLTEDGRLRADGSADGRAVHTIAGLRVAGYGDPFERLSTMRYADRYQPRPTPEQQRAFAAWLRPLLGKVDVVLVHEPALIAAALAELHVNRPADPLVFVVGHTHVASLQRDGQVTVLNGGSVGAGGTGNLAETTSIGLARLLYDVRGGFAPLAADLVQVDPGTGSATARRERLDTAPTDQP